LTIHPIHIEYLHIQGARYSPSYLFLEESSLLNSISSFRKQRQLGNRFLFHAGHQLCV